MRSQNRLFIWSAGSKRRLRRQKHSSERRTRNEHTSERARPGLFRRVRHILLQPVVTIEAWQTLVTSTSSVLKSRSIPAKPNLLFYREKPESSAFIRVIRRSLRVFDRERCASNQPEAALKS